MLEKLDRILATKEIRRHIRPVVERVRAELARKDDALMSWEPIQLSVFGDALPSGIRSAWVFILRAGADTGAECHPSSHQRMLTLEGTGDMRTAAGGSGAETLNRYHVRSKEMPEDKVKGSKSQIQWESNILVSDPNAPLDCRWISIPPNVWHRPVIPNTADWVVVSFHTVPAEELIEERPDHASGTKQMRYLD
jgi:hypothetical protein